MTEKEIIINGVNVAECENLYTTNLPFCNTDKKCKLHQGIGKTCNDYPDCYFKKWQNTLKTYRLLSKDELETKIENSQFKAELKEYQGFIDDMRAMFVYDERMPSNLDELQICIEDVLEDYINFKKALQEIKEIAKALDCKNPENCFENTPDWNGEVYGCEPDDWKEPSDLGGCPSKLAHIILKKCEAINEE